MAHPRTSPIQKEVTLTIYGKEKKFTIRRDREKLQGSSHPTYKVTDGSRTYYKKHVDLDLEKQKNKKIEDQKAAEEENKKAIVIEATVGQLFNMWMPYQPQVFLATLQKDKKIEHYILSEEVPGYVSLHEEDEEKKEEVKEEKEKKMEKKTKGVWLKFQEGYFTNKPAGYTGLGNVTAACYFCNEIDAKFKNLGAALIKEKNKVIKIDGDWCCASLLDEYYKSRTEITERGIKELPIPTNYKAHNWLDFIKKGVLNKDLLLTESVQKKLRSDPIYCEEVNETILTMLLTPNELFTRIAERNAACIKDIEENYKEIGESIAEFFCDRKRDLLTAALANKSFMNYLGNRAAVTECLKSAQTNMEEFCRNNNFLPNVSELIEREKAALNLAALQKFITINDNLVKKANAKSFSSDLYNIYRSVIVAPAPKITDEKNQEIQRIKSEAESKIEELKEVQKSFIEYAFAYITKGGHSGGKAKQILEEWPDLLQYKSNKQQPYSLFSKWRGGEKYDKIFAWTGKAFLYLADMIYQQLIPKAVIEKDEKKEEKEYPISLSSYAPRAPQIIASEDDDEKNEKRFVYAVKLLERLGKPDKATEVLTHFSHNKKGLKIAKGDIRSAYRIYKSKIGERNHAKVNVS